MPGFANAAENLGYKDELCSYTAAVTQHGSTTPFRNPQTAPASGHRTAKKDYKLHLCKM